ncbi:MAG: hypothetical protein ABIR59_07980 [Gemmatimonadales bacterium]
MAGSSPRHPATVAALVRRIDHTDPAALINAAWFAARRGDLGAARACAELAATLPGASTDAHRALAVLAAGAPEQLLLALPTSTTRLGAVPIAVTRPAAAPVAAAASTIAPGRALLDAGRVADSLAYFDGLAHGKQADSTVLFHRGVALAKMRRYRDAMHDWNAIERTDPESPLAAVSRRLATSARRLADLFIGAG